MRNHARATVAADFLVAITAGLRVLSVSVVMEIGSPAFLRCNVTAHPTVAWTLQQFREAVPNALEGCTVNIGWRNGWVRPDDVFAETARR